MEKLVADLIADNDKLRQELLELRDTCDKMIREWQAILQPYVQWAMSLARERMLQVGKQQAQAAPKPELPIPSKAGGGIDFANV